MILQRNEFKTNHTIVCSTMPFADISIGDIGTIVVGIGSVVVALLVFRDGRLREKDNFLNDIIKLLENNANRNARRRWFNTYGLKDDTAKEICLNHMNALTEVRSKGYSEEEIRIYAKSNILESQYETLSNFELASLYLNRYFSHKLTPWRNYKLNKDILLQMYLLDFLSIRKIIDAEPNLKVDMQKKFINLQKFFNKNNKYLNDKEQNRYREVKLPIKEVKKCENET